MVDILTLENVTAGYGAARILHDVSLSVGQGAATALLGRNGVGKTTLINTIVGRTHHFSGHLRFAGQDLTKLASHRRVQIGIGWVPQERNIFPSLTVEENLTAVARPGPWTVRRLYELFPRLLERRRNWGNQLSGGEQQMLAIARALVTNPMLLLLDEPLEGLAPVIVEELLAVIGRILREEGTTIVIVEQNARQMLAMTERVAILERGRVVHDGDSAVLAANQSMLERYLGVAGNGEPG